MIDRIAEWSRSLYYGQWRYLSYGINVTFDLLGLKNKLKPKQVIISDYDENLNISIQRKDHIGQAIYFCGYYESRDVKILKGLVNKSDIILDIGANIGSWTLIFSNAAPQGKVFAFEPSDLWNTLNDNIKLNPRLTNIQLFSMALGGTNRKVIMDDSYEELNNQGMKRVLLPIQQENTEGSIDMITLDKWVEDNKIERIDWIKSDTEGMEYDILIGGKLSLSKFKPNLLLEMNDTLLKFYGKSVSELYAYLKLIGYCFFYKSEYKNGQPMLLEVDILELQAPSNVICSFSPLNI